MARLFDGGFELGTNSTGFEFLTVNSPTVDSSAPVDSGTYSGKITSLTSGAPKYFGHAFVTANNSGRYFTAFRFYITTLPNVDTTIGGWFDSTGASVGGLLLSTTGVLTQYDNAGTPQFTSSAISTGVWHEIGAGYGQADGYLELRIDNALIGTTTAAVNAVMNTYRIGGNLDSQACTTISVAFDNWRINDTAAGGDQTGFPNYGEKLVLALPTGAGDSAGEVGTFSSINEIPPSDTSTGSSDRVELQGTTSKGEYNMTDSSTLGILSTDVISHIYPVTRVRTATAAAGNYQFRVKSAAAGTTATSTATALNTVTPVTNPLTAASYGLRYVSYTDPTTGIAWTPTGTNSIDNMQVGVGTTDGTPDTYVQWLGAYIGYYTRTGPTVTAFETTNWTTTTTPLTISVTGAVTGDLILVMFGGDNGTSGTSVTAASTSTTGGSTSAWTELDENLATASQAWLSGAWATVTANGTVTVSLSRTQSTGQVWGGFALLAHNHGGIGVHGNSAPSATETKSITISKDSTVAMIAIDWDALAAVAILPNGGTEVQRAIASAAVTDYAAYWLREPSGTRGFGIATSSTTNLHINAVEILAASAAVSIPNRVVGVFQAVNRASTF